MDIFEKQQTIEAIKTVVKARWFYVSIVILQGMIVKLAFPGVPLASGFLISLVVFIVFAFNFVFWISLKQPPEKISSPVLKIIKFSQVPLEQLGLSAIFYFSGTANKMLLMLFIIPIVVSSTLFKTKGVILATLSTIFLYNGLVSLEYFGLMPVVPPEAAIQSSAKLLKGESILVKGHLIGFNLYIIAAALYAGYLASLFKTREKRLVVQKNELVEKTEVLTSQTQELTKTKSLIQDALTKSDRARVDLSKAKEELEKANLELRGKIGELEKFSSVTIGRELKMVELKKEIKNLQETIKKLESQLSKKK